MDWYHVFIKCPLEMDFLLLFLTCFSIISMKRTAQLVKDVGLVFNACFTINSLKKFRFTFCNWVFYQGFFTSKPISAGK